MAKSWYILHVYSGYEKRIETKIRKLMDEGVLPPNIVYDVKVPEETVTEVKKDGKKRDSKRIFLPGYLMLQMDLPDLAWQKVCSTIRDIEAVTAFVGTARDVRPRPISSDEAQNLLQKTGDIAGAKPVRMRQTFKVGEAVKIIEGAFATFTGNVEAVDEEKNKLRVNVGIFGRITPVEVDWLQVEKV
jgi:transcriptional antiterminator NusG